MALPEVDRISITTVRAFDIDYVVPQHCTGIEAIAALLHRLPGKVVVSSVGSTFTWGAPGAPHATQSFGAPRSSRDAPR